MSDLGRDDAVADEDRLPWLEPVDEEDMREGGVAAGKLIGALIAALVAIGLIVGGTFWLRQRNTEIASAEPGTIDAPAQPYKVKPAQPGGMQVPGQGDASYSASQGADPDAKLDLNATSEEPMKAPPAHVAPAPVPPLPATQPVATAPVVKASPAPPVKTVTVKAAAPAKPAPVAVAVAPAAAKTGGMQIQLGAFSSQAKADAAWKSLSGRFSFLAPLQETVVSAPGAKGTVYRLRAIGGGQDICAKLKTAGETCLNVTN